MSISNPSVFPDISHVGKNLSRDERETIISRADDEQAWCITTFSPVMARKLAKLHAKQSFRVEKYGERGLRAWLPRASVSLRTRREISPEIKAQQAAAFRERLARASEREVAWESTR